MNDIVVFDSSLRPHLPPSTGYWLTLDGERQARLQLPDDLTVEEAERIIGWVREHLRRKATA